MSIRRALSKIKPKTNVDDDSHVSPAGRDHSPSPRRSFLGGLLRDRDFTLASSSDEGSDDSSSPGSMSKNQQKRLARRQRRQQARPSEDQRSVDSERRRNDIAASVMQETPEMKTRYGELPMVQSQSRAREPRARFESISRASEGQDIIFTARLHIIRRMSAKLVFLVLRQQVFTFQGVLHEKAGANSLAMVHWAEHLHLGTIVRVRGRVQAPEVPVLGCTVHDVELAVDELHVVVRRDEPVAFSVYEAEIRTIEEDRVEGRRSRIPDRTRFANRVLDLRTPTSQAVFRVQSAICNLFRSALDDQMFVEIHTPKLQGVATESGASVFTLNYFGRDAFLAQSPPIGQADGHRCGFWPRL